MASVTVLMGQPIETWKHVVETELIEPGFSTTLDKQMLLLLLHEAILLLKRIEVERSSSARTKA